MKVKRISENGTSTSWQIGDVTVSKIVESEETFEIGDLFYNATKDAALALPWLQPHFLTPEGRAIFSFHALIVETPTKRIIVDTCFGNDKDRMPYAAFSHLQTPFLKNLETKGFSRESFDVVLCTHLHMDHVGWNTLLLDGQWVPTFPHARYLFSKVDYDYWVDPYDVPQEHGWAKIQQRSFNDSVNPVVDSGLVDLVDGSHRICEEVSLMPTLGHSPGHVSVRIASQGQEALITGDMAHHPSQIAYPDWGLSIDFDTDQATRTRETVFSDASERSVLVIGTHWAGPTAGRILRGADGLWLKT